MQTVYGSSGPPYVMLDPSAKLVQQRLQHRQRRRRHPNNESARIPLDYTPYTPTGADDMTLSFILNGSRQRPNQR